MEHASRRRAHFAGTVLGLAGAAVALGLVAAPVATAAPAARIHWARVTKASNNTIADVGLVRGSDGILHVLWTTGGSGRNRIMDTPISASGSVLRPVIVAKFFLATDPDAAMTSAGLTVAWNGYKTSTTHGPSGTFTATRPRSGGSWSLSGSNVEPLTAIPFTSSSDAMASGSDGKPFVAFSGTNSLAVVHLGHKEVELGPTKACCVEQADLATDGRTGRTWITYASIIPGRMGIFARELTASGKPAGPARRLPGSMTAQNILQPHQRVGTTARGHGNGGVYVVYVHGYPFAKSLLLTKLPSGATKTIATFGAFTNLINTTVTADNKGRLFVAWMLSGRSALFIRGSNAAATKFGPIERVPLPRGATGAWNVYLSAKSGHVDVLLLATLHGNDNNTAYWHARVSPRLP
jgi:hypothetical protein